MVADRCEDVISEIGRRLTNQAALAAALEALPGWGPVTTGLFLRELRGVWPGARPPSTHERQRRLATWAFSPPTDRQRTGANFPARRAGRLRQA